MKDETTPEYYKGKNGYMAKDVAANFDLTYNLGSAMKYIIRAGKKEGNPPEQDIRKAINHLHFELDVLTPKTRTGALSPTGTSK
jgi:hypothetical protein|tara:strand:- start:734 stop:985 length:252 start_codon:yes stop_codon:yes gene_type:complete